MKSPEKRKSGSRSSAPVQGMEIVFFFFFLR